MPTYQYECDACEYSFQILQSMLDKKLKKCPQCGKKRLHRLIGSGSGIIFKGTGFYETDYKRKEPSSKTAAGDSSKGPVKDAKPKEGAKSSSEGKKENKTGQLVS